MARHRLTGRTMRVSRFISVSVQESTRLATLHFASRWHGVVLPQQARSIMWMDYDCHIKGSGTRLAQHGTHAFWQCHSAGLSASSSMTSDPPAGPNLWVTTTVSLRRGVLHTFTARIPATTTFRHRLHTTSRKHHQKHFQHLLRRSWVEIGLSLCVSNQIDKCCGQGLSRWRARLGR
jgi:hypothetical protein